MGVVDGGPGQAIGSRKQSAEGAGSGRREAFWGELTDWLDDWLAINPDGTVTAFSGKVELGTGVRTALAQIVAEELDCPSRMYTWLWGIPSELLTRAILPGA